MNVIAQLEFELASDFLAQSAGAEAYTDCIFAEGLESPNKCPGYDTKQSDGEVPVIQELWRMPSTPLLPSLPGPLWPGVVAPDRVLSTGQIELSCVLILNWIAWNRTVYMYKMYLALNKHTWLICIK